MQAAHPAIKIVDCGSNDFQFLALNRPE